MTRISDTKTISNRKTRVDLHWTRNRYYTGKRKTVKFIDTRGLNVQLYTDDEIHHLNVRVFNEILKPLVQEFMSHDAIMVHYYDDTIYQDLDGTVTDEIEVLLCSLGVSIKKQTDFRMILHDDDITPEKTSEEIFDDCVIDMYEYKVKGQVEPLVDLLNLTNTNRNRTFFSKNK